MTQKHYKRKILIILLIMLFTTIFMFYDPYEILDRLSLAALAVIILVHTYITIENIFIRD